MDIRPILSALLKNLTAPLLVALQVAISLAILANALYIVQSRLDLARRPSGISDEANVFSLELRTVRDRNYNQRLAHQQQIKTRLRAIPGVLAVGTINQWPMARNGNISGITLDRKQKESTASVSNYTTADSLLPTLGLRLAEGRDFTPDDITTGDPAQQHPGPKTVLVTRELAQHLYPGSASVIGKPVLFGTGDDAEEAHIIGVLERFQSIGAEKGNTSNFSVVLPYDSGEQNFAVRTLPGQRDRIMKEAGASLRTLLNEAVIIETNTVEGFREKRYQNDRTLAWMLISISICLLLVTISGIVGMSTVWVAQRRKQIGVRRALGARRIDILRHFVTENLLITGSGILAGALLALALNRILVSQLEMSKLPMAYLLAGSVLLLLLGMLSVLGPALRAASISPALATRSV